MCSHVYFLVRLGWTTDDGPGGGGGEDKTRQEKETAFPFFFFNIIIINIILKDFVLSEAIIPNDCKYYNHLPACQTYTIFCISVNFKVDQGLYWLANWKAAYFDLGVTIWKA